jgi:hypothetical protein
MPESETTLYEKFFGNTRFVYSVDSWGEANYGTVSVGPKVLKVVNVSVIVQDGKFIESLELENGEFLRGRTMKIHI